MSKPTHKRVKFSAEEMAHELPRDIDVRNARKAGAGGEVVRRLAERPRRVVGLDPDVAKVFRDSESVNRALRNIIASPRPGDKRRRKSA